jgi:flagellar biosynthesis protein FliP
VRSKVKFEKNERGSSSINFLIILGLIILVAYCAYLYVPVAYQARAFKDFMKETVEKGSALGKNQEWVKARITEKLEDYDVPEDAEITTEQSRDKIKATVEFSREIEFPGYVYTYEFKHTARSTGFLGESF